jgi:hypothetical protein
MAEAFAGPAPGTLTAVVIEPAGSHRRVVVRRVGFAGRDLGPLFAGQPLLPDTSARIVADPSGRYLIAIPAFGWIKDGKLVPLRASGGILGIMVAW